MMRRGRQFSALAGLTFLEAIRQPITLLLATSCVVLTAVIPLVQMHNFGEDGKLVRNSGLAFHFVFGLFMAVYLASQSLTREMRRGTASAVLSKPVSREMLFIAKACGVTGVLLLFSACAAMATLLAERVATKFYYGVQGTGYAQDTLTGVLLLAVPLLAFLIAGIRNYRKRKPFGSAAFVLLALFLLVLLWVCGFYDTLGKWAPYDCHVQWRMLPVSLLIALALVVLACLALVVSTRFGPIPTLSVCGLVFFLGLVSDYLFGRQAAVSRWAAWLYGVIPNWQHFWVADALSGDGSVPAAYVGSVMCYAGLYVLFLLCVGMISFRSAEVK